MVLNLFVILSIYFIYLEINSIYLLHFFNQKLPSFELILLKNEIVKLI